MTNFDENKVNRQASGTSQGGQFANKDYPANEDTSLGSSEAVVVIPDMSDTDYHNDRTAISSSQARVLLECPSKLKYALDQEPSYSPTFEFGKAAHQKVTGTGAEIHLCDYDNWRTKAAQNERDKAIAEGKIALLPKDYDKVNDMAEALLRNPTAAEIFTNPEGVAERSIFWTDESTGMRLKARPDWTLRDKIVDYKTAQDASPEGFSRAVATYGYHVQAAWYQEAHYQATGEHLPVVFVVQEKTAPYETAVYELDDVTMGIGRERSYRAAETLAECLESDIWPGYDPGITPISMPRWAEKRQLEDLDE